MFKVTASNTQVKIAATYTPSIDKYTATVKVGNKEFLITEENGSDLIDAVESQAGVRIEYNRNKRVFLIPAKNQF